MLLGLSWTAIFSANAGATRERAGAEDPGRTLVYVMVVLGSAASLMAATVLAGIALGIVSFPASNLGGFFFGMLLAIIGGSIGFAWTPAEAQPVPAAADDTAALDEPTAGLATPEPASEPAREGEPAGELSAGGATR